MAEKKKTSKNPVKNAIAGLKEDQQRSAQEQILQNLFEDMYKDRGRLYQMSFVKGIFIGLGTVIGGTVVVALLIWIMSFFINAPVIGDFVYEVQKSIEQASSSSQ